MIIEERTYLFKKEFCSMLGIPNNQIDRRKAELLDWLTNFYDFELLGNSPAKIKINRVIKEYQPIPRKYDSSNRKEQARIRKEQKEKDRALGIKEKRKRKRDTSLDNKGVYGIYLRGELVYIGKTTVAFDVRFRKHRDGILRGEGMYLYEQLHNEPFEDIEMKPIIRVGDLKVEGAIEDRDIGSMELALISLYKPRFNKAGITCDYRW